MAQTYAVVKANLDAAVAPTGGKFKPFDLAFYTAQVNAFVANPANGQITLPPLSGFDGDPLQHYVLYGAALGLAPDSFFNAAFYRGQYPDVANLSGADLLLHYAKFGVNEGRAPSAAFLTFDGARYLAENPDVAAYVNANLSQFGGSISNGSIAHYLKFGASEQRLAYNSSGTVFAIANTIPVSAAIAAPALVGGEALLNLNNHAGATTLTGSKVVADGLTTSTTLHVTGDTALRVDFTNSANQITGIDLNGNGTIVANGVENNVSGAGVFTAKNFTVIDAYARNPFNLSDTVNNQTAPIQFDGTGFAGDGITTNGNIFLGGLAADTAFGGIGNDFLTGGGGAGGDALNGGRNADFIFFEASGIPSTTSGVATVAIDGGSTADNTAAAANLPQGPTNLAGGLGTQDNDFLLFEGSDDNEPYTITLTEGAGGSVTGRNGGNFATLNDIESINASGNLYGFVDNIAVKLGSRATDSRVANPVTGTTNFSEGSTAQLTVNGDEANNIIIGGYDNDNIAGNTGNDLLFGGDLRFLLTNKNNPNLLNATGGLSLTPNSVGVVFDGRDILAGGAGNDTIVFEADGGTITGDADTAPTSGTSTTTSDARAYNGPRAQSQGDTLFLTDFSTGRLNGATLAGEATASADALTKLTTDSVVRFELGNPGGATASFKNYGGANTTGSQDTTNYVTGVTRTAVSGIESVNATGLGTIDYSAAGTNPATDATKAGFVNVQNYNGLQATLDLRGNGIDNVLLANNGNDTLEGRGGDDVLSGGAGKDFFVEALGDGVEWIARPVDANNDGLWDTTGGLTVQSGLAWGQDFRAPAAATAGTTTLVVNFGSTILNGTDTFVATFQVNIDGKTYGAAIPAASLAAAKSTADVANIVNAAYQAIDKSVTVVATSATTIEVRAVDTTPADGILPVIGTTAATGFFVAGQASGGGTYQATGAIAGLSGTNLEDDRLIIKSYADRSINLGVDQTKIETSQATAFTTQFASTGSQLAQGQAVQLYLDGVREGDTVNVIVNGTTYSYTTKAGENSENVATNLAAAIVNSFDINSASGQVVPTVSLTSFGDSADLGTGQAGVSIGQANVGGSLVYMNVTATVTRTDGQGAFGTVATHNQSGTFIDILGFDARNGALNSQDAAASPVILFQGRNSGVTTTSLLLTAKDSGGVLNGMDATQIPFDVTVTPAAGTAWINGDDLLIGGKGNDTINAGTGDDRILMSQGVDTVDGGGNITAVKNVSYGENFNDVLQAEESTFGAGSNFLVTLDGTVGSKGAGTVAVFDSKGVATPDVTTFTNIEEVRVLENNRNSTLNVKVLSDNIAVAVGNDGLVTEGLDLLLTKNASTTYFIDSNNNGVQDAGEVRTTTAVLGTENVTTGGANDRVTLDQTQLSANNKIDLGGQLDNTVLATLREGADVVTYNHADINNDGVVNGSDLASLKPTITLAVTGASASTVKFTGGALGTTTTSDTLVGVEIVNFAAANTGALFNDTIDLSGLTGATLNLGVAETVGKSLGGQVTPVTTVAALDANTLDAGGIALNGTLGTELQTIGTGATQFERVTGSAGDDRVIVANVMQTVATGQFAAVAGSNFTFNDYSTGTTTANNTTKAVVADQGLYQFNLGAGTNDSLDYKQETGTVAVSVDTSATDADQIYVDARVDYATGVERYFGGSGANVIDLSNASVATTIQYSKESKINTPANESAEPTGNNGTVVDGLTNTAVVSNTADGTVYAKFTDRTGAGIVAASAWNFIYGSNAAETVIFSDNETAVGQSLVLRGGANKVDYTNLTTTITAAIGAVNTATVALEQVSTANGDTIRVSRETDPNANYLNLVGSSRAGDQLDVTALANLTSAAGVTTIPNTSQVDPQFHVVDLANGVITQSFFGQYTDVTSGKAVAAGFKTFVSGFENATNGGDADVVHLLGDGGRNSLTGGTAADLIYGGRGTAGDGTADVGAGNRGDLLTGGAGADVFMYKNEAESPGGTIAGNQQLASNFGNNAFNVTNSIDTISDFLPGTDKLAFVINDTYQSVRANGAIPANLGGNLNAVTALTTTFAAGDTKVNITNDTTLASIPAQVDNYDINNTAATLTIADVILRVNATSGSDIIDASAGLSATALNAASTDGLRVDVVYTAASQSQGGGFDSIIHFTSGSDKIDLSFLQLARYESKYAGNGVNFDTNNDNVVDAIGGGNAIRSLGAAPIFAINSDAAGLFNDAGTYKPIASQSLVDGNGDVSTTLFIDANGDGNYTAAADMVIVLVGVTAPVTGDFIFNQYGGGWA